MRIRIAVYGLTLALAGLLAVSDSALAQRDTTTMIPGMRAHRGMGMRAHGRMGMMRGAGVGMRGSMRADHIGPRVLLGLKDELELSDEQVTRLEKIQEEHHALMQAQLERLRAHRETIQKARAEQDWDALEKAIDEGAKLRTTVAKGMLNVERRSLEVLNDAQREKYTTWREGVRLFRRQRMDRWQGMHGRGMRGQGVRRQRGAAPPDSSR